MTGTDKFLIKGGRPLQGRVEAHGSKNAASKMMIASLLTEDLCVIENVPLSAEIDITKELCETIGSSISVGEHRLTIRTESIKTSLVPEFSRRNRIPVLALGPLLHRRGFAEVPVLGGCPIGHRPVNLHIDVLTRMGAKIERRINSYYATTDGLRGAEIEFPFSSVGATESAILAATLAQGKTTIKNAAVEPEIINLVEMLRAMGALVNFDTQSRVVEIEGVSKLHGAIIKVMPDRNEVVSLASAALATGGELEILGIEKWYLESFLENLEALGASYKILPPHLENSSLRIKKGQLSGKFERKAMVIKDRWGGETQGIKFISGKKYKPLQIETAPHPGFMTDWQQPMCVLLTQAYGESIIHETVYEDRFGYVKDLNKLGAHIQVSDECWGSPCRFLNHIFNHSAKIAGPTKLRGGELNMTDIRAGMAHIIAALMAQGESVISGVEHIDRGYEKLDERLRALGADITRIH